MKKIIIKSVYLAAVFFVSLFVISTVMNQGNTDMTAEMGPATYPVVHMYIADNQVNALHGYKNAMKSSYQRESITPLAEGRKVRYSIDKYGQTIEKLAFEVRSIDGERLVENTEITEYKEDENTISGEFAIKDLIEENKEYMLVFLLENGWGQTVRYYTRIIWTEDYHTQEKIEYVLNFHRKTFHKEAAKELTKYLESNEEGDNTSFAKVDIHSSFDQVTWGDLDVEKVTEPILTLKEISSETASVELHYVVALGAEGEECFHQVKEFYRIRYTADRIYLLDYERTMKQMFYEGKDSFAGNKIMLGITAENEIQLEESDGGNVLAFTDGSRLYSYNVTENKLSRLFGFYNKDNKDERSLWQKYGIRILNVDEAGNVQFIVYGYMNRGKHEGEVGISVYRLNGPANTVEELLYVPIDSSYEVLHSELKQLAYINKSDVFFFMYEGSIYAADLESKSYEVIVSDLKEGSFKISESERMAVWQLGEDSNASDKLVVMNLNTKKKTEISAGYNEYIKPLGFMNEDIIYGVARKGDIVRDNTGGVIFPMYAVRIQDENGEILKTYQEEGIYVSGSDIEENQINLYRLQKKEGEEDYIPIGNDQIVNTEIESSGSNQLETVAIDKYEKITQIAVKKTMDTRNFKLLTPKEVLFEGGREIILKEKNTEIPRYYVYAKNGIEGVFTDEGNAVNLAYEKSGVVVDEKGAYVWIRGNRSQRNQIMAIKGAPITEEKNSLAVCLDTMLAFEGIVRNSEYMLNRGQTAIEILEENLEDVKVLDLTGCSLDAVLYYPNMDIPVLASMNDGNAVLIIGFNELNTVLMDPLTGSVFKKGMNDSKELFEQNGNCFITYMRTE